MSRSRMFGDERVGAVTIVEAPVSRSYMQKARVAFLAVTTSIGTLAIAALATVAHSAAAVVFGALVGAVCGLFVASAVRAWPVLRVLWHWGAEIAVFAAAVAAWPSSRRRRIRLLPPG